MASLGYMRGLSDLLYDVLAQVRDDGKEANPQRAIANFLQGFPQLEGKHIDVNLEHGFDDYEKRNRETDIVARGVAFEVKKNKKHLGTDAPNDAGTQIARRLQVNKAKKYGWATNGEHWLRYVRDGEGVRLDKKFAIEPSLDKAITPEMRDLISTLKRDLEPRPTPTGDAVVEIFTPIKYKINHFASKVKKHDSYKIKYELWQEQLRGAHMQVPEGEEGHELFANHTLLTAAARLIAAELSPVAAHTVVERITAGGGFVSWLYWEGEEQELRRQGEKVCSAIYQEVIHYDWGEASGDILKHLYHDFIPRKDRHDFGEYYTPDWLADMVTERVLDADYCKQALKAAFAGKNLAGLGVLDPGCGSGTFLRAAAKRFLHFAKGMGKKDLEVSNAIAKLVYGFDIHPVAIELARATLLGALPTKPSHPLQIYLGDALQMHRESFSHDLGATAMFEKGGMLLQVSENNDTILFPQNTLLRSDFEEIVDKIAGADARGEQIEALLDGYQVQNEDEKKSLREAARIFQQLRDDDKNGIWAWFIKNLAQPHRLASSRVARIIGNPPWITYNDWEGARQEDLRNMASLLQVWQGGKSAPQNDLAALFVVRSIKLYWPMNNDKMERRFGFVLPGSALKSVAWEKFRNVKWGEANLSKHRAWVVETKPRPFPQSASCVIFGVGDKEKALTNPQRMYGDCDNPQFADCKTYNDRPSDFLGIKKKDSLVRNGATLFPHVLVRVHKKDMEKAGANTVQVKTSAGRHQPWKSVGCRTSELEEEDLRPAMWSNALLPFRALDLDRFIMPLELRRKERPNEARRFLTTYWLEADGIWRNNRKERSVETLTKRCDYSGALSSQLSFLGNPLVDRVIYNGSGKNISAVAVGKENQVIIEHKLYRVATRSLAEAHYLAALLNSDALQPALLATRNNDRDFDTLPFQKIPIRGYDDGKKQHTALAELGKAAAKEAAKTKINEEQTNKSRADIRNELRASGTMQKIDEATKAILPDYCG